MSDISFIHLQLEIECTWMRETNIDWIFQGPACAVSLSETHFVCSEDVSFHCCGAKATKMFFFLKM